MQRLYLRAYFVCTQKRQVLTSYTNLYLYWLLCEPVHEKTNNMGSDQVRHKPACTVTEDGLNLEILDLESRGIVLSE